jgi:hypothetical protein
MGVKVSGNGVKGSGGNMKYTIYYMVCSATRIKTTAQGAKRRAYAMKSTPETGEQRKVTSLGVMPEVVCA